MLIEESNLKLTGISIDNIVNAFYDIEDNKTMEDEIINKVEELEAWGIIYSEDCEEQENPKIYFTSFLSWEKIIKTIIIKELNEEGEFSLDNIYKYEDFLKNQFPYDNTTKEIKAVIKQFIENKIIKQKSNYNYVYLEFLDDNDNSSINSIAEAEENDENNNFIEEKEIINENTFDKIELDKLYNKIIEGYLIFKSDFEELILEHEMFFNVFMMKNQEKSKNLIRYFKWFKKRNENHVKLLLNDEIADEEFKSLCLRNKKDEIILVKEKPVLSFHQIYDIFIKTALFFGKSEKLYSKDFFDVMELFNIKPYKFKKSSHLDSLWSYFLKLNKDSNLFYEYKKNENDFFEFSLLYFRLTKTYKKLENINIENKKYFVANIFKNKDLKFEMIDNNIITVENLIDIDFELFESLFDNYDKLDELDKIIKMLEVNLKVLFKSRYLDFIGNNYREFGIIVKRSEGVTLESIGNSFNITRERVRQIENKIQKKYFQEINKYRYNILKFLNSNGSFVTEKRERLK